MRAWSATTGAPRFQFAGQVRDTIEEVQFSRDGARILLVAGAPTEISVWNAATGERLFALDPP